MADKDAQAKNVVIPSKKSADVPRSAIKNPVVWGFSFVLLVVVVIAFVVMPINTGFNAVNNQSIVFGTYDGVEIAYKSGNYFASQYDAAKANAGSDGADNVQAEYSALKAAFDRTVLHTAILRAVQKLGVSVSDAKINETLAADARFQENGVFSRDKLNKYNQLEMMNLRNLTRDDLLQSMLMQDVVNGAVNSTKETAFITDMGRLNRSFEYVSFETADYPDSEVLAFAQANTKLFSSLALSMITVAKKADADTYRQQIIDKKTTFEDAAKNFSMDMYKASSGARGQVSYHDLKLELGTEVLADKIFGLKNGEISEVITVANGFALFRLGSEPQNLNIGEAAAIKTVRDYLVNNEKGKIEDYLNAQAAAFSAAARKDGLEKAAKALGKKPVLTNSFPINVSGIEYPTMYGNFPVMDTPTTADNKSISNAGDRDAFFEAAFKLTKDQISDPVVLADSILVLKLKEEKQLADADLGMFASFAPNLARFFVSADLGDIVVDKSKLTDNFDKTFIAHFVTKQ